MESISLKAMNGQVCQSMGRKHHPLFVCFIGLIVNSTLSGKHLNCLVILIVFKIFYLDKYVGLGVGGVFVLVCEKNPTMWEKDTTIHT